MSGLSTLLEARSDVLEITGLTLVSFWGATEPSTGRGDENVAVCKLDVEFNDIVTGLISGMVE